MPEKPLTIATYAAGASLAAAALIYVFGPTFFLDDETSKARRRNGVVGLSNPANDCFINSVLQAMAGLGNLRTYLIREVHRRRLEGPDVHDIELEEVKKREAMKKENGVQQGLVTQALKEILDSLNERPIYRKTISPQEFIGVLEHAFVSRISRQQQDAQEFLQIVTERLCDEYHIGRKARRKARRLRNLQDLGQSLDGAEPYNGHEEKEMQETWDPDAEGEGEESDEEPDDGGFPFEGKLESQVECLTCHFKPRPAVSSFVTLTLNVPKQSYTSLGHCFDSLFTIEHIDDYSCDRCRLQHALDMKATQLVQCPDASSRAAVEREIKALKQAIIEDPETPPVGVELPSLKTAPKRRISRHSRISVFPKILAIHLSRSIFDPGSYSTKNMAKVCFPETLPLGSLLAQRRYKLRTVIMHKGGHSSGHYETMKRQLVAAPFSTPISLGRDGVYSRDSSPAPSSAAPTPRSQARDSMHTTYTSTSRSRTPDPDRTMSDASALPPSLLSSSSPSSNSTAATSAAAPTSVTSAAAATSASPPTTSVRHRPSFSLRRAATRVDRSRSAARPSATGPASTSGATDAAPTTPMSVPLPTPPARTSLGALRSGGRNGAPADLARLQKRLRKAENRWWRISDDHVKECKTGDVLGMQREVYLLFYEMLPEGVEGVFA